MLHANRRQTASGAVREDFPEGKRHVLHCDDMWL
jgi:hypothetical protein